MNNEYAEWFLAIAATIMVPFGAVCVVILFDVIIEKIRGWWR